MSTYTYTNAYTRAEAVVDQVSVLFTQAGIDAERTKKICLGVNNRWFTAVGLYLQRSDKRVYEIEAAITWSAQSDVATLAFSTDLPGWENRGSPEAIILGTRFAAVAKSESLPAHYWGHFTSAIQADPALYAKLCSQTGLHYGGKVPDWASTPKSTSFSLQDLGEVAVSERSAL